MVLRKEKLNILLVWICYHVKFACLWIFPTSKCCSYVDWRGGSKHKVGVAGCRGPGLRRDSGEKNITLVSLNLLWGNTHEGVNLLSCWLLARSASLGCMVLEVRCLFYRWNSGERNILIFCFCGHMMAGVNSCLRILCWLNIGINSGEVAKYCVVWRWVVGS